MTTAQGVDALVAAAKDAFGGEVHILVNLAGGMVERRPLAEIDEAFFDKVMTLNLKSAYLMTRAVAPLMPCLSIASRAPSYTSWPKALFW